MLNLPQRFAFASFSISNQNSAFIQHESLSLSAEVSLANGRSLIEQGYTGRFPFHAIAEADFAAVENLREHAAAPTLSHQFLQSGKRLVHLLAGTSLAVDLQARVADEEHAAARALQVEAGDHQVRTARAGIQIRTERVH